MGSVNTVLYLPRGQLNSIWLKYLQSLQPRAHNLLELLEGVGLEGQSCQPLCADAHVSVRVTWHTNSCVLCVGQYWPVFLCLKYSYHLPIPTHLIEDYHWILRQNPPTTPVLPTHLLHLCTLPRLTSLLETRFIMIRSGRSIVLATASTIRPALARVGQSNRLYSTVCLRVHSRSSCMGGAGVGRGRGRVEAGRGRCRNEAGWLHTGLREKVCQKNSGLQSVATTLNRGQRSGVTAYLICK